MQSNAAIAIILFLNFFLLSFLIACFIILSFPVAPLRWLFVYEIIIKEDHVRAVRVQFFSIVNWVDCCREFDQLNFIEMFALV